MRINTVDDANTNSQEQKTVVHSSEQVPLAEHKRIIQEYSDQIEQ